MYRAVTPMLTHTQPRLYRQLVHHQLSELDRMTAVDCEPEVITINSTMQFQEERKKNKGKGTVTVSGLNLAHHNW